MDTRKTTGAPAAASTSVTVPEHLLPKLRRQAAFDVALAGHNLDEHIGDLDTLQSWQQFGHDLDMLREHLRIYDDVQRCAGAPEDGMVADCVATLAASAAHSAAYRLEDAPSRAQDAALADGLLNDVQLVRELHALANEAKDALER